MSEYHDPTYQEAYPAGADAHGGEAVYGDDGVAYGDDGVAYGDEGAAYGDDGPAYGDEGPAYGDQGPSGYGSDYDQAADYDPYSDPDQLYADDGVDPYADEFAPEDEQAAPAAKGARSSAGGAKPKKPLILAAVGLALVGALGAGGYFLMVAPSGGEGGEASPGFDLSSLTRMIPFLGAKDSEETIAASQANLMAVKRAIDTYARENGKLPSTTSAIESQLERLGVELASPYDAAQPVAIELGEAPTAAGVIVYTPKGKSYELRAGDAGGQSLKDGETELIIGGAVPAGAKGKKPVPVAAAGGAKPGKKPAAAPTPTPTNPPGVGPDDEGYIPQPSDAAPAAPAAPPAAGTAIVPGPPPPVAVTTPPPIATPSLTPVAVLRKRNQEFDRLRNEGIGLLYQKRTAEAIVAFRRALLIKPNDVTVRRWLETIQGVVDKHTLDTAARMRKERSELLQKARMVAPPPAPVPDAQRRQTEAMKLLDELKDESAPDLAAPKLEN